MVIYTVSRKEIQKGQFSMHQIFNKEIIKSGSICWLHFYNQAKVGHKHAGDYAYIKGNAPNHSMKIEDDELYVQDDAGPKLKEAISEDIVSGCSYNVL